MQIGVCSWVIDRHDPARAIQTARRELNLSVVQVGFFAKSVVDACDAAALAELACTHEVSLAGTFAAFEGEDYSSVAAIAATGGLMPDDMYPARLEMLRRVCTVSRELACDNVGIHVGTVPEDEASPDYAKLRDRLVEAADICRASGQRVSLETGREPVDALVRLIDAAGCENIGVSFDPANLIVYGTDDAVRAVRRLRGRIDVVHVKDAVGPESQGAGLGRQSAVGTGAVEVARVVSKLRATGYDGPLLIESKVGEPNLQTIRDAAAYLRSMLA